MSRPSGELACLADPVLFGCLVFLVCVVGGFLRFPLSAGEGDPFKRAARAFSENGQEDGEPNDARDDEAIDDRSWSPHADGDVASDHREARGDDRHGDDREDVVLRGPQGDPDDRNDEQPIPRHVLKLRQQVQR